MGKALRTMPRSYIHTMIYCLLTTLISLNLIYKKKCNIGKESIITQLQKIKENWGSERLTEQPEVTQLISINKGLVWEHGLSKPALFSSVSITSWLNTAMDLILGWQYCPP